MYYFYSLPLCSGHLSNGQECTYELHDLSLINESSLNSVILGHVIFKCEMGHEQIIPEQYIA